MPCSTLSAGCLMLRPSEACRKLPRSAAAIVFFQRLKSRFMFGRQLLEHGKALPTKGWNSLNDCRREHFRNSTSRQLLLSPCTAPWEQNNPLPVTPAAAWVCSAVALVAPRVRANRRVHPAQATVRLYDTPVNFPGLNDQPSRLAAMMINRSRFVWLEVSLLVQLSIGRDTIAHSSL